MKNFIAVFICVIVFIKPDIVQGQKDMYGAGGVVGVNFTSLTPDQPNNFTGLNAGVFGSAKINKHFSLKMEILLSQNGDYVLPESFPRYDYGKIRLNHVEVPLHFDCHVNSFKSTHFLPNIILEAGGAYVKLLSYYAEDAGEIDVTDLIIYGDRDSFLIQIGATYFFTKHFGGNLRFSKTVFENELSLTTTFRLIYQI